MSLLAFFFLMIRRPPRSTRTDTLFPYTTLFRSGSSFRFRQAGADLDRVATALAASYVLVGVIESWNRTVAVTLELIDTNSREVIWADRLVAPLDGIDDLRTQIVVHLVSALEIHIPFPEARRSEERRVGQACASKGRSRWVPYH